MNQRETADADRRARVFALAGLLSIALGLPSLSLVDARAENAWTFFGCASILSGYTLLGISIALRRD